MILLNVWKKQPHFSDEKGKRYVFSNISCRANKYNKQVEFNYDPEYYGSHYQEQQEQEKQRSSQESSLGELLKEFGCSPPASLEEVRPKRRYWNRYWNQVLHPDFNVGKPEKSRKQI
jgi:hypothetical protein